jgi:uncharacterized CHY-type Zn-finger protein
MPNDEKVLDLLSNGEYFAAIQCHQEATGHTLRDTKAYVDHLERAAIIDGRLPRLLPNRRWL